MVFCVKLLQYIPEVDGQPFFHGCFEGKHCCLAVRISVIMIIDGGPCLTRLLVKRLGFYSEHTKQSKIVTIGILVEICHTP